MVALPTRLLRRQEPAPAAPPQPEMAAVAVFPVLGSGIYLIPQDAVKQKMLGPVVWDVFSLGICPRQWASDAISHRFGIASPLLTPATREPAALITSGAGNDARLIEVTCFFTPARDLMANHDFPGQRRLLGYEVEQLLRSPNLFMPEALQFLPAVVQHWSSGQHANA